jgi:hypothetical protein
MAAVVPPVNAARHRQLADPRMTSTATNGSGNCLDEITLAEFAEGRADSARRTTCIAHLTGCDHCRQQLASVLVLLSDATVARSLRESRSAKRATSAARLSWRRAVAVSACAAAVTIAVTLPRLDTSNPTAPSHRGASTIDAQAPVAVEPTGDVSAARALRWTAVSGADRYRVTLFASGGRSIYEIDIHDTTVTLPDSVIIVPGQSYLWKVEARVGIDRWSSSELMDFTVRPRP